jgi:hypothetical protein
MDAVMMWKSSFAGSTLPAGLDPALLYELQLLMEEDFPLLLRTFVSDVPPLNQPPLKGDLAYGIGLGKDHGWVGHNGEIPGFNTYLFYHPELDAVVAVEVNSDISSGDCPKDTPTMSEWPRGIPCDLPADRIFRALAEALGKPAPSPPSQ